MAVLGVLGWRFGTGAFVAGLRVITVPSVLAALGIGLLTTVLSAGRWCLVARRVGLRLPLSKAVEDYYRALFLNAVLPAGVLGDVHRAVAHGRQSGDVGRGVRAVVLERVAGQAVLLELGAVLLLTRSGLLPDLTLGLPVDVRDFGPAVRVLKHLGVSAVRLMPNNDDKVRALEEHGISVTSRVSLLIEATDHNIRYLTAKRDRLGHDLPHLAPAVPGGA
ncbi:lysylphosphatidylglycerol synthase domain-containing protein [Amycolatopsis sp. H20-H5]|nr:lysylphosphatidylglycerol synthase domain-containing protein [Amycolatopsis sp. H20-H5]MEC3982251.1 lysylphosphatidylglycerol synthase domain-containing protein [Amycolatopsis sp. H20-H5]